MHSSGDSNPCLGRDAAFRPPIYHGAGKHIMAEIFTKLSHSPLGWESRKEKEEVSPTLLMAPLLEDPLQRGLLTVLGLSNHVTQEPAFNIRLFVGGGIQIKKYSIGVFCFIFIWFFFVRSFMFYLLENFIDLFWACSHRSPLLGRLPAHPTSCSHSLSNEQVKALWLLVGQKNPSKQEKK